MVTIKDVARLAGVSISTVSNYLNNRPNLSRETAQRVQAAIDRLQYVALDSAREVKRGKMEDIGIVFPSISDPYLEKLMTSIKGCLTQSGKNIQLTLTDGDPTSETRALESLIGRRAAGIILYTCQPGNKKLFDLLERSGITYVLVDRRPENLDCNFVSVDNRDLFFRVTRALYQRGAEGIGLVCGPREYQENSEAYEGYAQALRSVEQSPDPHCVFTTASRECGFRAGVRLLEANGGPPRVILTTSYHLAEGIRYAMKIHHLDADSVRILSTGDSMDDVFHDDSAILKTSRNAFQIGEEAGRLLLENMRSSAAFDRRQLIFRDEFSLDKVNLKRTSPTPKPKPPRDEICALVLDEEMSLAGLDHLLVDFYARENVRVQLKKVLPGEAFRYINEYCKSDRNDIDVILFDVPWLAYFASEGYLLDISEYLEASPIDFSGYIPGSMENFGLFQGRAYALPYVICSQLLFYRKDLFENKALASDLEKRYMISLKPPGSWFRFNTIARYFTRAFNPDSPVEYGHSMALSNPSLLTCDLMPRVWECGGTLVNAYNQLDFNSLPNRKGTRNLLEAVLYSAPGVAENRPTDAVENFLSGKTAMLYTFQNFAVELVDRIRSRVIHEIGYAKIPGNSVLSGWSLGVLKNSRRPDSAFKFIKWASGADIAIPHAILGGQSPNISVYRNYDLVSLYPWLPMAKAEFAHARQRFPTSVGSYVINADAIDNCIYEALSPMVGRATEGSVASLAEIGKVFSRLRLRD